MTKPLIKDVIRGVCRSIIKDYDIPPDTDGMKALVDAAREIEETFSVSLVNQNGNFTVVAIGSPDDPVEFVGVSKCNPKYDEFNPTRGVMLALTRAVKMAVVDCS
jgi:hypothetical protein